MKKKIYQTFLSILEKEDKEAAVLFAIDLLNKEEVTLPELYLQLLTPAMHAIQCVDKSDRICVWKEHLRSAIIATIIGSNYPYVLKHRAKSNGKKIVIACPDEEYHELGALIATQLFTLVGFDCYYIGANTPIEQILSAVDAVKADYLAISVTNYYNTIITKELLDQVKINYPAVKIIVGGQAFSKSDVHQTLFHHYHLDNFEDIQQLAKEIEHETSTANSDSVS